MGKLMGLNYPVDMKKVGTLIEAIVESGPKIKALREKIGMSRENLADKTGISLLTLEKMEEGIEHSSIQEVRKILLAMNCKPSALLNNPDKGLYVSEDAFDALSYALTSHKKGIVTKGLEVSALLLKETRDETESHGAADKKQLENGDV